MSTCSETAGFLISAPCKRKAERKCASCKKPICPKHTRNNVGKYDALCIGCYRKVEQTYHLVDDDPYLYSRAFYNDYYFYADGPDDPGVWAGQAAAFVENTREDQEWENDFDGS